MADKKAPQPPAETEQKSNTKLIIIIAAALVVLILAIGGTLFFYLTKEDPEDKKNQQQTDVPVPVVNQKVEIGPMVDIENFVVNIIGADSNHYVKAALTLELSSEAAKEEVTKRMPQVRDSILLLFGNKTYEELQDLQGKKQLKAELTSKLNGILQSGSVNAVFFTEFVVQ